MTTRTGNQTWTATLTVKEREAFAALRVRYEEGRDVFTRKELASLHFLRWLVGTGRLEP